MSFATFELAYWQILKEEGQRIMKRNGKKLLVLGIVFMVAFAIWTVLIQIVDVQTLGQNGTEIGFATFNCWFHRVTGVHRTIYIVTDWLGLVPLFICILFACIGLNQWRKRRSLCIYDE